MLAAGRSIGEVCQVLKVSEATFHRPLVRGMQAEEVKRLKELEQENKRVKKLLAWKEFESLPEARAYGTRYRLDYNHRRPHSALGYQTPAEFAARPTPCGVGARRLSLRLRPRWEPHRRNLYSDFRPEPRAHYYCDHQ